MAAECNTIFSDYQLRQLIEWPYRELSQFSFLMNTEMVLETSVYSSSNHLTPLLAQEYFIKCGIPVRLYRNGTANNSACHGGRGGGTGLFFLNTSNGDICYLEHTRRVQNETELFK
jgi:hypothetical protein